MPERGRPKGKKEEAPRLPPEFITKNGCDERMTASEAFDLYAKMESRGGRSVKRFITKLQADGWDATPKTIFWWADVHGWDDKIIVRGAKRTLDTASDNPVAECLARMRVELRQITDMTEAAASLDAMAMTTEAIIRLLLAKIEKLDITTMADIQRLSDIAISLTKAQAEARALMTVAETKVRLPALMAAEAKRHRAEDIEAGVIETEPMKDVTPPATATQAAPQLTSLLANLSARGAKPKSTH